MIHEDPSNLVEHACQAAFDAAEEVLAAEGASLEQCYITMNVSGQPGGEPNAASSSTGAKLPEDPFQRGQAVLAFLVGHAVEVGEQLGVHVYVAPIGQG